MIANLKKLTDEHFRKFAFAFLLKISGAFFAFLVNMKISNSLGSEATGVFFLGLTIISIIVILAVGGLGSTALKIISEYYSKNQIEQMTAYSYKILKLSTLTLSLLCVALIISNMLFNLPFPNAEHINGYIPLLSLLALTFGSNLIISEFARATQRISLSILLSNILTPLITLSLLISFVEFDIGDVFSIYLCAQTMSIILGITFWRKQYKYSRNYGQIEVKKIRYVWGKLYRADICTSLVMPWLPILVLGYLNSLAEVGIFGIATRNAMVASFILTAVTAVNASGFRRNIVQGNDDGLRELIWKSNLFALLVSTPITVFIICFSGQIMGLFGDDFESGASLLIILTIAQFVHALTGSAGYLLIMSNFEQQYSNIVLFTTILMILVIYPATSLYGVIGSALAVTLVTIIQSLLLIITVRYKLDIAVWNPRQK